MTETTGARTEVVRVIVEASPAAKVFVSVALVGSVAIPVTVAPVKS